MKISIGTFKGTIPKLQKDKLSDEYGSVCVNADLDSMGIAGIPAETETETLSTAGPYTSIYQYEKNSNDFFWNAWTQNVKVARSPLANDTYNRVYFTGMPGLGGSHPYGTNNMLRAFSNDIITGGAGTHDQDDDWYSVGIEAPTNITVASAGGGSSGVPVTRAYTVTFVSSRGEEGPPGTPDSVSLTNDDDGITITFDNLTTMGMTAANKYAITKVRVYMSATNSTGFTDYFLVHEHTLTGESDTGSGTITTIDGTLTQLGEVLVTTDYNPPPDNLDGLVQLPNGWIAGFVGNRVYVCEPYLPYAWPEANTRDLPYDIIGLGVIGQTIVAITEGYPYLIYGADPSQLRDQQIAQFFPGLTNGSIFSAENTVFYAGTDGVIAVTQSGAQNITDNFLKKPEYEEFSPESSVGAFYDGHYFLFSPLNSDGNAGFVIDIKEATFRTLDEARTAVHISKADAKMYTAKIGSGGTNQSVWEWRGSSLEYLQWTWKSKKFILPRLINFGSGRVVLDLEFIEALQALSDNNTVVISANAAIITAGGVQLNNPPTTEYTFGSLNDVPVNIYQVNGDPLTDLDAVSANLNLTFNLYADRELVFTRVVDDSFAFKMQAGYKAREYEIELIGEVPVRRVEIATTMKEMAS